MLSAIVSVDDIQAIQEDTWKRGMERAATLVKGLDISASLTKKAILAAKNDLPKQPSKEGSGE